MSSGEHVLTTDGKKFYQHTVTLRSGSIINVYTKVYRAAAELTNYLPFLMFRCTLENILVHGREKLLRIVTFVYLKNCLVWMDFFYRPKHNNVPESDILSPSSSRDRTSDRGLEIADMSATIRFFLRLPLYNGINHLHQISKYI